MPMSTDEWVEGYRVAWENRDADAAAALFTPDATYRDSIFEEANQGREGVFSYWQGVTADQTDIRVRMGSPYADGSRVAVEFWTNMKAEGDDATIGGCLLLDFADDGLCRRLHEYWAFTPGAHEPPTEWGD